ncbi:hypothetical protein J2T60_002320 [Natronospira proteinivora]|uniref:DUF4325 domain-containing protein n=1 Tax=Natronospira proteinivora TaxID=1807133 RepID=A0ABT1GBL1_9GAMM|nr:STAS-like domain-containing protein [Natronospira proteinivora]MCP1728320.1 hypothetical protein [Natronospira proteinivora]
MKSTKIIISKEFSVIPLGRYLTDGPNSGERFRKDYLVPALRDYECVEVDLDGTRGYGSSFLDEAFGGLVRDEGIEKGELKKKLRIKTQFESLIKEIMGYIEESEYKQNE